MYDIYGNKTVVFATKPTQRDLLKVLQRFKDVYVRSPVTSWKRTSKLQWISPYQETSTSSLFLHEENGVFIYGDLKKAYYNPRYSYERAMLKKLLSQETNLKTLGVFGFGLGPFCFTLGSLFESIYGWETNKEAVRLARINSLLNKIPLVHESSSTAVDVLVSVRPSIRFSTHLNYAFKKILVFYALLPHSKVHRYKTKVSFHYGKSCAIHQVRKYAQKASIYRFYVK